MVRSRLVDKGQEIVEIYPEVDVINAMGVKLKAPADVPVRRRATISRDKQSIAELPGQVQMKIVKLICRWVDGIGPNSRVSFRGEDWDLAEPPHFSSGASRATSHMELLLRSRNQLGGGGA